MHVFPIITLDIQKDFENSDRKEKTPDICGYYGRACRQMNASEGANRSLCDGCPLARFARVQELTQELDAMEKICKRAQALGIAQGEQMTQMMDLQHAHEQFALRLNEFLDAPDFDFEHDFIGIQNNIDRKHGGKIGNCFVPRYAGRQ